MNDYIQKYGQNAIQAYKKKLRVSESIQKHSPRKQDHLLPKQSMSKKSLKSCHKNVSKTRLNNSKSIKNTNYDQVQYRKKGYSVIENKKGSNSSNQGYLLSNNSNGFSHTFNKNLNQNPLNKQINNKKKLIITSAQPQISNCSTPMRSNLSKYNTQRMRQHRQLHQVQHKQKQKQKVTQRLHRNSSGPKQYHMIPADYKKKVFIQNKLQETLTQKRTIKSFVKTIIECFEILFGEDEKMRKVLFLFKQIIQKISSIGESYKSKLKRANQRIKIYKDIQTAYIGNQQMTKTKIKLEKSGYSDNSDIKDNKTNVKKKQTIQMIILNQNYQLRKKIQKLQKQLDYYSTQQASLMNVFGRYKNSQSQLKIIDSLRHNHHTNINNSINNQTDELVVLNNNNNKKSNRRSSQNLFAYQQQQHLGVQKRLSFDPYQMATTHQFKNKYREQYNSNKKNNQYGKRNPDVEELQEEQDEEEQQNSQNDQ